MTRRRKLIRADYARGLPDYHDPTGGWAGAAPMYSALTLRLWVAGFGVVFCVITGALWLTLDGWQWFGLVLFAIAAGLLVDFGWVVHRKRRGEPG
jgi:membrane protein implicated in regulation of membrane protease activity